MDKIINLLINNWTKGVDTYTHNGSTWLIFTEQRSWVIELTESKTLWYNYNFFKELFSLTSMDVVDNQHYITKWVEDNVINKVKDTILEKNITEGEVEEIIENGVKYTSVLTHIDLGELEDTIQNGVKRTQDNPFSMITNVEDAIQNGVKETNHVDVMKFFDNKMDDALENGIKETHDDAHNHKDRIDGVIKGGVKHTEIGWHQCNNIDDAIENGVKVTLFNQGHKRLTVENGVRHTLNTEYMPTSMVEDIIENGVKETKLHKGVRPSAVEVTIKNGVSRENSSPFIPSWILVEDAIKHGVKETKGHGFEQQNIIDDIVKDGVKETKTPGNGDILSTIEWMEENKSTSYTKMIDDVIDYGIKKTMLRQHITDGNVETIIETGIKEVQPLPDQSGELIGYGNYYKLKEDRTKPFIDYLEETIKCGEIGRASCRERV
jgi:hypothetical protein